MELATDTNHTLYFCKSDCLHIGADGCPWGSWWSFQHAIECPVAAEDLCCTLINLCWWKGCQHCFRRLTLLLSSILLFSSWHWFMCSCIIPCFFVENRVYLVETKFWRGKISCGFDFLIMCRALPTQIAGSNNHKTNEFSVMRESYACRTLDSDLEKLQPPNCRCTKPFQIYQIYHLLKVLRKRPTLPTGYFLLYCWLLFVILLATFVPI